MKIVVCVKEVVHLYGRIGNDSSRLIDSSNCVYIPNPWDIVSVEQALRIRENSGSGKVTIILIGPARAEKVLRECLAMGADEAIRIWDSSLEYMDAYSKSRILSKALDKINFDLLFFGSDSLDSHGGEFGGMVAEHLGIPLIAGAIKMELLPEGKCILVHRCLERGDREIVECSMPVAVTVEKGLNSPRYPTQLGRLISMKKPIKLLDISGIGLNIDDLSSENFPTKLLSLSSPRPKTRKAMIPDNSLSAEERMEILMSGGIQEKKDSNELEGNPEEIAFKIVEILVNAKIIELN